MDENNENNQTPPAAPEGPINPYAAAGAPGSAEAAAIDAAAAADAAKAQTPDGNAPISPTMTNKTATPTRPAVRRPIRSTTEPNTAVFIAGAIIIGVIVILVSYALKSYFHTSPYGPEVKIENFDTYFKDTPQDRKDAIYSNLYDRIESNLKEGEEMPTSGARVRQNTAKSDYNTTLDVHYGNFIVDIPKVRQTYHITFEWSSDENNPNLSGYSVVIKCPAKEYIIYEDQSCTDPFTEEDKEFEQIEEEFPVMKYLPIDIDYFNSEDEYVSYRITNNLGVDSNGKRTYSIVITDKTGGNFEAALDRIRSLTCNNKPCNPNDYTIKYVDKSSKTGYAGNS